jgi:hypothetical protein
MTPAGVDTHLKKLDWKSENWRGINALRVHWVAVQNYLNIQSVGFGNAKVILNLHIIFEFDESTIKKVVLAIFDRNMS